MNFYRPEETIIIRPMEFDDLDQVDVLEKLSFSLPWPKSAFEHELLENPKSILWVAESSSPSHKRILGMIVVWLILDEAHIAALAVHPDYRGRGIAKALITRALSTVLLLGAISATLEVRANNHPAILLYRNMGFEIVGKRKGYYRDNNEDAIIMTLHQIGKIANIGDQETAPNNILQQNSRIQ